jgi:hypothetical protein
MSNTSGSADPLTATVAEESAKVRETAARTTALGASRVAEVDVLDTSRVLPHALAHVNEAGATRARLGPVSAGSNFILSASVLLARTSGPS